MTIDIDEELISADWIKAGKPLDTVAAIQERVDQDRKDRIAKLSAGAKKRRDEKKQK